MSYYMNEFYFEDNNYKSHGKLCLIQKNDKNIFLFNDVYEEGHPEQKYIFVNYNIDQLTRFINFTHTGNKEFIKHSYEIPIYESFLLHEPDYDFSYERKIKAFLIDTPKFNLIDKLLNKKRINVYEIDLTKRSVINTYSLDDFLNNSGIDFEEIRRFLPDEYVKNKIKK